MQHDDESQGWSCERLENPANFVQSKQLTMPICVQKTFDMSFQAQMSRYFHGFGCFHVVDTGPPSLHVHILHSPLTAQRIRRVKRCMHNSRHSGKCFGKMVSWAVENGPLRICVEMYPHSMKFFHTVFDSVSFLTRPFDMCYASPLLQQRSTTQRIPILLCVSTFAAVPMGAATCLNPATFTIIYI